MKKDPQPTDIIFDLPHLNGLLNEITKSNFSGHISFDTNHNTIISIPGIESLVTNYLANHEISGRKIVISQETLNYKQNESKKFVQVNY